MTLIQGAGGETTRLQVDDVFTPIRAKAAKAVGEAKMIRGRQGRQQLVYGRCRPLGGKSRQVVGLAAQGRQLYVKALLSSRQHDTGSAFQQDTVLRLQLPGIQQEDAAARD